MILQELIRNFILYRGVVKPMLSSWKDSFTASYYREIAGKTSFDLSLALRSLQSGGGGEELGWDISDDYEEMSLAQTAGTRTITNKYLISQNNSEASVFWDTASVSKKISIVLMGNRLAEEVINTRKTKYSTYAVSSQTTILATEKMTATTTGFENKQIKSFLMSETHEKREYLGEFSLTHEEIPLLYLSERGCVS